MSAPDTCPQCGAGLAASDHAAAYRCGTLVSSSGRFYHTGVCRSFAELRKPLDAERDQLETELQTVATANAALVERVITAELVLSDPHALWANWLRGAVRLPSGIGDIRECSEKMKRFRSRWIAAHHELRKAQDRIERAEERVKRLEEVGDKMAAAFDKEWLGDADIECIQDDWDEAKGQP